MIKVNKWITKIIFGLLTACVSPYAFAAGETPWKSYLFLVMGISLVIATIMTLRNKKVESRMAKLLLTGLYFWVLTFAQLTILGLVYYFSK